MPFAIPAALSRVPWKLVGLGIILLALLVQTLRLDAAQNRAKRYKAESAAMKAAIDEADRKAREAQKETQRQISQLPTIIERAVPKGLETRPLPPNCATPDLKQWRAIL